MSPRTSLGNAEWEKNSTSNWDLNPIHPAHSNFTDKEINTLNDMIHMMKILVTALLDIYKQELKMHLIKK